MPVVTHVAPTGPRGNQVVVHLGGECWTAMPRRWAAKRSIEPGRALLEAERATIEEELALRVGRFLCLASLDRGGRSRAELSRRLERYGLPSSVVERALASIDASGLTDDDALARSVATSLRRRGYGDGRIRQALARRGLADTVASAPPEPVDDVVARAVEALGRRHRDDPRRAIAYLARRGFPFDVCRRATEQRAADDARASPDPAFDGRNRPSRSLM